MIFPKSPSRNAQIAVEYMLLFAVVALVVLIGFATLLPRSQTAATEFFNKAAVEIMGDAPPYLP